MNKRVCSLLLYSFLGVLLGGAPHSGWARLQGASATFCIDFSLFDSTGKIVVHQTKKTVGEVSEIADLEPFLAKSVFARLKKDPSITVEQIRAELAREFHKDLAQQGRAESEHVFLKIAADSGRAIDRQKLIRLIGHELRSYRDPQSITGDAQHFESYMAELLESPNPADRYRGVLFLGGEDFFATGINDGVRPRSPHTREVLLKIMRTDTDEEIRKSAAWGLRNHWKNGFSRGLANPDIPLEVIKIVSQPRPDTAKNQSVRKRKLQDADIVKLLRRYHVLGKDAHTTPEGRDIQNTIYVGRTTKGLAEAFRTLPFDNVRLMILKSLHVRMDEETSRLLIDYLGEPVPSSQRSLVEQAVEMAGVRRTPEMRQALEKFIGWARASQPKDFAAEISLAEKTLSTWSTDQVLTYSKIKARLEIAGKKNAPVDARLAWLSVNSLRTLLRTLPEGSQRATLIRQLESRVGDPEVLKILQNSFNRNASTDEKIAILDVLENVPHTIVDEIFSAAIKVEQPARVFWHATDSLIRSADRHFYVDFKHEELPSGGVERLDAPRVPWSAGYMAQQTAKTHLHEVSRTDEAWRQEIHRDAAEIANAPYYLPDPNIITDPHKLVEAQEKFLDTVAPAGYRVVFSRMDITTGLKVVAFEPLAIIDPTEYEASPNSANYIRKKPLVISIGGTASLMDVYSDLSMGRTQMSSPVLAQTLTEVKNMMGDRDIMITGHSLGGAVSAFAAYRLQEHVNSLPSGKRPKISLVTWNAMGNLGAMRGAAGKGSLWNPANWFRKDFWQNRKINPAIIDQIDASNYFLRERSERWLEGVDPLAKTIGYAYGNVFEVSTKSKISGFKTPHLMDEMLRVIEAEGLRPGPHKNVTYGFLRWPLAMVSHMFGTPVGRTFTWLRNIRKRAALHNIMSQAREIWARDVAHRRPEHADWLQNEFETVVASGGLTSKAKVDLAERDRRIKELRQTSEIPQRRRTPSTLSSASRSNAMPNPQKRSPVPSP